MRARQSIPLFLLASFLVHGVSMYEWEPGRSTAEPRPPGERVFELVPVPPEVSPAEPPQPHGQVVDDPRQFPEAERPPEDARFLSERNVQVAMETRGVFGPTPGSPAAPAPPTPPARPMPPPEPQVRGEGPGATREIFPSFRDLWKIAPPSGGSADYLEGLAKGEITALNTQAYRYAAFYNRVKDAVRAFWDPIKAVERSGQPRHNLDSYLRVVTDADGKLLSVEVIHSCGYPKVDEAAVAAIRQATPFYGVPEGVLNAQRQFDEVWGFHVVLEE